MEVLVEAAGSKAQLVAYLAEGTTIYGDIGWNLGPMITIGKHFDGL
jgi:hypothetical protein